MELSLADGTRAAGTYSATLPTGALSTGVHFVRLDNIGTRISRKIVLTE
jgi:hypothetical protein